MGGVDHVENYSGVTTQGLRVMTSGFDVVAHLEFFEFGGILAFMS